MREQAEHSMQQLTALYENYLDEALKVELARKPGEGIFGIGKRPSDDPCHDRFAADLKEWLEAFGEEKPDSAEIREVLSLIYRAPKKYPDPKSSFWMLIAVQSLTLGLIPRLSESDARALVGEFAGLYKRWERLPVQKQILDALIRAEKQK